MQQSDAYDHNRHHADKKNGAAVADHTLYVWDCVRTRDDSSWVCLHPSYISTKVECKVHWPTLDGELPRTGPGGTSGPGAFRHFVSKHVDAAVRFDAFKPFKDKGKGKVYLPLPSGQGQSDWQ